MCTFIFSCLYYKLSISGSGVKPHYCSDCGKSYKFTYNLYRHQRYECSKEPQFQCPYCPKKASFKFNLMSHIKTVHKDIHQQLVK